MDLIISTGCSYERGLGLNFYRWKEANLIKNHPYIDNHSWIGLISQEDSRFMEKNNYTGLVAKYFNSDVHSSRNYGCGNDEILNWCVNHVDLMYPVKSLYNTKLIIVGLSDPYRDFGLLPSNATDTLDDLCEKLGIKKFEKEGLTSANISRQISAFDDYCEWWSKEVMPNFLDYVKNTLDCPILVWSWHKELQKSVPKENRVWFKVDGDLFRNYSDVENNCSNLKMDVIEGVTDQHPNLEGHRIIADNIIRVYNENFT